MLYRYTATGQTHSYSPAQRMLCRHTRTRFPTSNNALTTIEQKRIISKNNHDETVRPTGKKHWKQNGFLIIHNNCIFPHYGYSIEIIWIYCGFSGAIANLIAWISHFPQGPQHNTLQPSQYAYAKPPQQQCGKPWNYGEITEEEPTRSYTIRTPNGKTRRIESRSHQHHHHQVQELILIKEQLQPM